MAVRQVELLDRDCRMGRSDQVEGALKVICDELLRIRQARIPFEAVMMPPDAHPTTLYVLGRALKPHNIGVYLAVMAEDSNVIWALSLIESR